MALIIWSVQTWALGPPRPVSRFGLAVRRQAGKQKDLGSIPPSARLSLQKGCGLWTLSCDCPAQLLKLQNGSHRCLS